MMKIKILMVALLCLNTQAFNLYLTQDIPPKPIFMSVPIRYAVMNSATKDHVKAVVTSFEAWKKTSPKIKADYQYVDCNVRFWFIWFPANLKDVDSFTLPIFSADRKSYVGADIYFNTRRHWTLGQGPGLNLYHHAAHEIGHLWLAHSNDRRALMTAHGSESVEIPQDDDKAGIEFLFGN